MHDQVPIEFRLPDVAWVRKAAAHFELIEKTLPIVNGQRGIVVERKSQPTIIFKVLGDGNCLHRSIGYFLCGDQDKFAEVKHKLLEFGFSHPAEFPLTDEEKATLGTPF